MQKGKQRTQRSDSIVAARLSFKCHYCAKNFASSSLLMCHMQSKHTSERIKKIKITKTGFADRSNQAIQEQLMRESKELAENLQMQNPLQWLPPLEDSDSQDTEQPMEALPHNTQASQRPDNSSASDETITSTRMWQNLRSPPIIDLTATSEKASTESEGLFQRMSNNRSVGRMPQQRKEYRLQSGIVCLGKKVAVQRKNSSTPEAAEMQPETTPPSISECPSVVESAKQDNLTISQQGHFTLCPNGRALKCNYCMFMCRRTCGRMIKHLQVHGIRSRNQCKSCGLGFLNKSELQDHQKVCVQASLAPQCSECGKTFSFRSLLRQHMNTHITKKPFKCEKCPMAFISASLCKLHMEKQHPIADLIDQVNIFQCTYCVKHFENKDDLNRHLRQHIENKSYKRNISSMDFSTPPARDKHINKVRRAKSASKNKDEAWLQACLIRPAVTSSGIPSIPVSIPTMTMPIVVSVSSQNVRDTQNKVLDVSPFTRPMLIDGPSELTAGSPERIDDVVDPATSGLVYMRRELNPDASNEERDTSGPSVLRTWSVSDSSDPMASSESAVVQVEEEPDQTAVGQLILVKKEREDGSPATEIEQTSIVSAGRSSVESASLNHGPEGFSPIAYRQQHEPTSTARENEGQYPIDVYPAQIKPYTNQNAPGSNDNQRLLDVSRVVSNLSPDGSYGRKSTEDTANPESPCGATSTRKSLDSQDAFPGSLRCFYCDITFGDPIMHYLHMGWHVTGDPWKCNGCGQECVGKVDFFLHLYKVGHK